MAHLAILQAEPDPTGSFVPAIALINKKRGEAKGGGGRGEAAEALRGRRGRPGAEVREEQAVAKGAAESREARARAGPGLRSHPTSCRTASPPGAGTAGTPRTDVPSARS